MARRYVGKATVYLAYSHSEGGRDYYKGRVVVREGECLVGIGGKVVHRAVTWPFQVGTGIGGVENLGYRLSVDHPLAYDAMASTAVTFGSSWSKDAPDDPGVETACVIEEATQEALREDGGYEVRRKP